MGQSTFHGVAPGMNHNNHQTEAELSIIVPVYNESEIAAEMIVELAKIAQDAERPIEVIVVDDGSTDGTSEELESIRNIRLLKHRSNRGYGASLKTGILASEAPWFAITDADGTYPNARIPELWKKAMDEDADMLVGARTGKTVHIPLVRRPAKWAITRLASYLSGENIPDLNSGLRIFKRATLMEYLGLMPEGFSFTTTSTLALLTNDHDVMYVPIDYSKRGGGGSSKIRPIKDTLKFAQLIVRMVMYFNPLRVFLPISMMLFGASMITLVYRAVHGKGLVAVTVMLFIAGMQMLATGMLADLIDRRLLLKTTSRRKRQS